jgi:hypothetical protein
VDQPLEHLGKRLLRPDQLLADDARDDAVVADAPDLDPLIEPPVSPDMR